MKWLIVLLLIAIVAIAFYLNRSDRRQRGQHVRSSRNLFNLEIGDLVEFEGLEWFVEDVLKYDDSGFKWTEYRVQSDVESRWLSVEQDDGLYVCWMRNKSGVEITGEPPRKMVVDGAAFRQVERGTATLTRPGSLQTETCRYYEYEGEDDDRKRLSIEDWDGKVEVSIGRQISPRMLSLTAGDGQRVYGD
jgi:hypothetical protein